MECQGWKRLHLQNANSMVLSWSVPQPITQVAQQKAAPKNAMTFQSLSNRSSGTPISLSHKQRLFLNIFLFIIIPPFLDLKVHQHPLPGSQCSCNFLLDVCLYSPYVWVFSFSSNLVKAPIFHILSEFLPDILN